MSLNNNRVLITGATGFIGSNLTKALVNKGARVIALTSRKGSNKQLIASDEWFMGINKWETGNVVNFNKVNDIVARNKIEIIFHLAAQALVEKGAENPAKTFKVNVEGTWNVLEAARRYKVKKVIVASTTHVYGDNPNIPYKEEYCPRPTRPYETSKACAELIARSYASTYGLYVCTPRFVNVYGPGDLNFIRLVPNILKTVINGESPMIWNKRIVRDFLYVDDAVRAYLAMAEKNLKKKEGAHVFNFGSGKARSIYDIAEKIVRISKNKKVKITKGERPEGREGEILKQYVTIAKAKKELGWGPKVSLNEGLKKTYSWYKNFLSV